jgi:hypothetical protein
MHTEPFTPLAHMPWLRWIDRTGIPAVIIGIVALLIFLPFYNFSGMAPRMPLQGGVFPPAFALALTFLLQLTRGASADLHLLISAEKVDTRHLTEIAAGPRAALAELVLGIAIGIERVYSQLSFSPNAPTELSGFLDPSTIAVCLSITFYTVVQVHLLAFCIRQVLVFRRIASHWQVDLLAHEFNNILSNPLIRFVVVGFVAMSFGMLVYQAIPFESLRMRVLESGLFAGLIWVVLMIISLVPLFILRSRIATAKKMEINLIRLALKGQTAGIEQSQFGTRIATFSPADLMFYEDRIKNIWEWPFEAHVRRLVIFGLLPPLTWVLAAAVEVIFEALLIS